MGERVGGDGPGDPKKKSFGRRAIDWIVGLFGRGVDKGYKSNVRLKANNRLEVGLPTRISEEEYQASQWDAGDTHYQKVTSNTLVTRKIGANNESPQYRFILPQNFGGWGQDNTASDGLIYKGCLSCHADNGAFTYAVKNSSTAGIGKSVGLLLTFLVQPGGSSSKTTISRATDNFLENEIAHETGYIMSDAARQAYIEATYSGMSQQQAVDYALKASQQAHADNIAHFGSLQNYMNAHTLLGTEINGAAKRSMISFSTDESIISNFGKSLYKAKTKNFTKQTIGGESEVFIFHMIKVKK